MKRMFILLVLFLFIHQLKAGDGANPNTPPPPKGKTCADAGHRQANPQECKGKKTCKQCPGSRLNSVKFVIPCGVGSPGNEPDLRYGEFILHEQKPSEALFSPAALDFTGSLCTPLISEDSYMMKAVYGFSPTAGQVPPDYTEGGGLLLLLMRLQSLLLTSPYTMLGIQLITAVLLRSLFRMD